MDIYELSDIINSLPQKPPKRLDIADFEVFLNQILELLPPEKNINKEQLITIIMSYQTHFKLHANFTKSFALRNLV